MGPFLLWFSFFIITFMFVYFLDANKNEIHS